MSNKKKLTLDDFLLPTLADEPTRLPLKLNGADTSEYIYVIGSHSALLKRPVMAWGFAYNKAKEECNKIEDLVDRAIAFNDEKEKMDIDLAAAMVSGWSLGEFNKERLVKLLTGNAELVQAIHSRSYDVTEYIKKK